VIPWLSASAGYKVLARTSKGLQNTCWNKPKSLNRQARNFEKGDSDV